jgi:hypothetical protein
LDSLSEIRPLLKAYRTGNAPENLSTMRKLALQIISEYPDKLSLKKRRLKAAYDMEYLKKLIT